MHMWEYDTTTINNFYIEILIWISDIFQIALLITTDIIRRRNKL